MDAADIRWLPVALVLVGAGVPVAAAKTTRAIAMDLHLTVTTPADQILVGTELRVRSVLRNDGTGTVDLPAAGQPAPLTFVVRDEGGRTVATGSGITEKRPDVETPMPAPRAVPAGGEVTYDDDVSSYLGTVLGAGRYELVAELRREGAVVASGSASFTVLPLVPEAVVRIAGLEGAWLSTLVSHRGADGRHTLLYSFSDRAAGAASPLRPVLVVPPSGQTPPTLALVPQALVEPSRAWIGILEGGRLRGAVVRPGGSERAFGPIGIEGEAARLLHGGAPLSDGGALIMATTRAQRLAVVRIAVATEAAVTDVSAPASIAAAERVVSVAFADRDGRVYLCWVEDDHTVRVLSFDPAVPDLAPQSGILHRADGRIVALQADPPDPTSASWVHVVDVSGGDDGTVTLTRLNPVTGLRVDAAQLPAPPVQRGRIRRWLLPSWGVSALGPLGVLTDDSMWLLRKGTWARVDVRAAEARSADLVQLGDALWLSSWSAKAGVLLERVPAAQFDPAHP